MITVKLYTQNLSELQICFLVVGKLAQSQKQGLAHAVKGFIPIPSSCEPSILFTASAVFYYCLISVTLGRTSM